MTQESVNMGRQLKFAREYRGYSQTNLCKEIEGLSQPNLSMFEKGFEEKISMHKLKEVMLLLEWPFNWLYVKSQNYYA